MAIYGSLCCYMDLYSAIMCHRWWIRDDSWIWTGKGGLLCCLFFKKAGSSLQLWSTMCCFDVCFAQLCIAWVASVALCSSSQWLFLSAGGRKLRAMKIHFADLFSQRLAHFFRIGHGLGSDSRLASFGITSEPSLASFGAFLEGKNRLISISLPTRIEALQLRQIGKNLHLTPGTIDVAQSEEIGKTQQCHFSI